MTTQEPFDISVDIEQQLEQKRTRDRKEMKRDFSRCGWSLFAFTLFVQVAAIVLSVFLVILTMFGINALDMFNEYLLIFNEALIAISVLVGLPVLIGIPHSKPQKHEASAGLFFKLLIICFPVAAVGNTIGNMWLGIWNIVSGNDVTNQLVEILMGTSPWQIILCTGILAPILEELFFRKLIIDRMHRHSETAAILVSAALFGLFHQNFSQFFYAFGVGVILGYLYCRTGSYIKCVLLHMAFNFILGVIPSLLSIELLPFFAVFESMPQTEYLTELLPLVIEYALPLSLYLYYMLVTNILNIVGVVLFIINVKRRKLRTNDSPLSAKDKARAAVLNSGIIAASCVLLTLMALSLFS